MQHIVTKFVIKFLAFAYLIFAWKCLLFFFSKIKKSWRETARKIRLIERYEIDKSATPTANNENPIAFQRFWLLESLFSHPQTLPLKNARTMLPYAAITWIDCMQSIQVMAAYGSIVLAFLSGSVWGWENKLSNNQNLWNAIGFSLLAVGVALLSISYLSISLIFLAVSLQLFFIFEKKNSKHFHANIKYANARNLITNLVTICCITSLAFIFNPYT